MISSGHDFWSHISRSSTRIFPILLTPEFSNTEISDVEVTIKVENQVFRFNISVYYFIFVDIFEATQNTSNEEFYLSFREPSVPNNMISKISSVLIVHN